MASNHSLISADSLAATVAPDAPIPDLQDELPGTPPDGGSIDTVDLEVGKGTLGRVFNLLGDPIDNRGPVDVADRRPIHREPPEFTDLTPIEYRKRYASRAIRD